MFVDVAVGGASPCLSVYDLEYIVIRCIPITQPASDRMIASGGTHKGFLVEEDSNESGF